MKLSDLPEAVRVQNAFSVFEHALTVGRHWLDQEGVNAAYLEALSEAVRRYDEEQPPEPFVVDTTPPGPCDECDPSFGCFARPERCCKRPDVSAACSAIDAVAKELRYWAEEPYSRSWPSAPEMLRKIEKIVLERLPGANVDRGLSARRVEGFLRAVDSDDWAILRLAELRQAGERACFRLAWQEKEGRRYYRVQIRRQDGSLKSAPSGEPATETLEGEQES